MHFLRSKIWFSVVIQARKCNTAQHNKNSNTKQGNTTHQYGQNETTQDEATQYSSTQHYNNIKAILTNLIQHNTA